MKKSTPVAQAISALKGADIASHDIAQIAITALSRIERMEPEDLALCTGALLEKMHAPILRDTLFIDPTGKVYLDGKPIKDLEVARRLFESSIQLRKNYARKMIRDQMRFAVTVLGINKSSSLWDIVFAKAVLWWAEEEEKFLDQLAGTGDSEPDDEAE